MKTIYNGYRQEPTTLECVLNQVGTGWHGLVTRLIEDLFELNWDGQLHQIKEKFGGLRFYIGPATPQIRERIGLAERESYQTCESCGLPGSLRGGNWLRTLCDKHAESKKTIERAPVYSLTIGDTRVDIQTG